MCIYTASRPIVVIVVVVRHTTFAELGSIVDRQGQGTLDNKVIFRAILVAFSLFLLSIRRDFLVLSGST
jgi:hypothetical protein